LRFSYFDGRVIFSYSTNPFNADLATQRMFFVSSMGTTYQRLKWLILCEFKDIIFDKVNP